MTSSGQLGKSPRNFSSKYPSVLSLEARGSVRDPSPRADLTTARSRAEQIPARSEPCLGLSLLAVASSCFLLIPLGFLPSPLLPAPGPENIRRHGLGYPPGAPPAQGHQRARPRHRGRHQAVQQIRQARLRPVHPAHHAPGRHRGAPRYCHVPGARRARAGEWQKQRFFCRRETQKLTKSRFLGNSCHFSLD